MNLMQAMKDYTARTNGSRSLEEAVSEVQREIEVRRRLYDRWISEGKLSRIDAHDRLERMLSALKFLLGIDDIPGLVVDPPVPPDEHTKKVLGAQQPC